MLLDLPRPTLLGELPPGEPGTRATLDVMRALVKRYKSDPSVRDVALSLTGELPPKQWAAEVAALFRFVRDGIRYVRDVRGVETLQTPPATLELEAGDCDDKSTLLASLLEAIGHPTRFVAVGFAAPRAYSHVYVETLVGRQWVPLDATMSGAAVGWAPSARRVLARMIVHN